MALRRAVTDEISIRISSDLDIVAARRKGREVANYLGFGPTDLAIIATAISELARNILLYAHSGGITLKSTPQNEPPGMLVVASDEGPGISDVTEVMQGGLGLGLPGIRRLMDGFEIVSEVGRGTKITATKWKR